MDDYVESLEEIREMRKASRMEDLTRLKFKQYRKMVGKFNWLAHSTRHNLCYTSFEKN